MRAMRVAAVVSGLWAVLASAPASGAGFGLNEHGAAAMAMAGAYTAIAATPEATFFNPAGLATLKGLQFAAGFTMITPGTSYKGIAPGTELETRVDAERLYHFVPNAHIGWRVHERVAVGFGLWTAYGLTQEWPSSTTVNGTPTGWWGRGLVEKISLESVYLTPTVAINLHPRVQIGGGFSIVKAAVSLTRAVTFSASPADDINVELSAGDVGFAGTAGLLVSVIPDLLNAGFTYRSGTNFTFSGNAAFSKGGSASAVPASLRATLIDGPAEAGLNLPHVFSFGLAAFPVRALTLGFSFDVITWSSYDKLEVKFLPTAEHPERAQLSSSEPKNWNNTVAVRVGAEYRVLPQLPVRAGFIYDQGPPPLTTLAPELPDGDRYELTLGLGYEIRGLRIDAAYQFITTGDVRTAAQAPLVGTYNTNAHLVGFSLGYALNL